MTTVLEPANDWRDRAIIWAILATPFLIALGLALVAWLGDW
jgi:hypothetical protein